MRSPVCGQVNPTQGFVFFPEKRFAFRRNPHSMKGKPVAQKVQVLLVDDLNGGEADETVTFALDGKSYEIDLSDSNAAKLRESLADFVKAGRRTGGRASSGRGKSRAAASGGSQDTAKIRAWAKENGYNVNDRGRVPADIREAFEKANG
ncbi:Lsr2 family protein [Streptomyces kronopolitis]|uniref:Lsr2 family protein n=1 Tax=Streptomyces kronopolitis TaxID=1612435 RepID=A0ABQ2JQJ4_9ACTN|nr:Lsr2 family protein [Streptomyces kronopolitis]GLW19602.1 Lsr2 family protein [Streptomyces sp. NBRC 13847]